VERFDVVVVGAGAAGLAAARAAVGRGRGVLLVDAAAPGGDCTFFGCVPSKTMLDVAARVAAVDRVAGLGLTADVHVDFAAVMEHVAATVGIVAADESPAQLQRERIEFRQARASFLDAATVDVGGDRIHASRVVVATGARTSVPVLPGLSGAGYLDNRTVFELREQPHHLIVLGGGTMGVEMAQAFRRLGSAVTLVEAAPRILTAEEPETSDVITTVLRREGVEVVVGTPAVAVDSGPTLRLHDGREIAGSHLLVAVGREPATTGLNLDVAGVATDARGFIVVDRWLRTTARSVYAAGDCATPLQFTHVADEQGRLAAVNALASPMAGRVLPGALGGSQKWHGTAVPWVTFTSPEVGRVGLTEAQAYARYGSHARVAVVQMGEMDRPRTTASTDGFVKLIAAPSELVSSRYFAKVVGMTVVAPTGGELIHEGALAMRTGMLAARLAQTVHAYPAYAIAVRVAAARLFGRFRGIGSRPARPGG
jgi:pyruvate/2-oxoglutarate dehydrogenase complex dihydrolipoamide dehydrogenase (E3) component